MEDKKEGETPEKDLLLKDFLYYIGDDAVKKD
jgi:hypothetical protein